MTQIPKDRKRQPPVILKEPSRKERNKQTNKKTKK
jgi:hypothetical protein